MTQYEEIIVLQDGWMALNAKVSELEKFPAASRAETEAKLEPIKRRIAELEAAARKDTHWEQLNAALTERSDRAEKVAAVNAAGVRAEVSSELAAAKVALEARVAGVVEEAEKREAALRAGLDSANKLTSARNREVDARIGMLLAKAADAQTFAEKVKADSLTAVSDCAAAADANARTIAADTAARLIAENEAKKQAELEAYMAEQAVAEEANGGANLANYFVGEWNYEKTVRRGDVFTWRGSSFLCLIDSTGIPPIGARAMGGNEPRYAVLAVAGSPGAPGSGGGGDGTGLLTLVSMPANTAASGAAGQYALDADLGHLAIYVTGAGWIKFQGFQF